MEILSKGTVSKQFRAIRPKLYGNCAFPQNFHTNILGEIKVFKAVMTLFFDINDRQLQLISPHMITNNPFRYLVSGDIIAFQYIFIHTETTLHSCLIWTFLKQNDQDVYFQLETQKILFAASSIHSGVNTERKSTHRL